MTLRSTKPNRCKHCKVRMPEDKARHVIHDHCIEPFLAALAKKRAAEQKRKDLIAARLERAERRVRRERIKTIPQLIAEAQKEFNAYIRERDRGQPCICCGRPLGMGNAEASDPGQSTGGLFDCGHYRSTGSASHLRFHEDNAHAQRKHCNRYGAGRAVDYRIGLIARIGEEKVLALEANNTPVKWDRDQLKRIKAIYREKTKQLTKEAA